MSSLRDTTRTTRPGVRSWGAFPSATTLPNTEFGPVTGELFPGDLAVVAGVLYRCTDSTVGSATWEQIPTMADVGAGTVTGTGTDNQVARWDGTSDIQGSLVSINDAGEVTLPSAGAIYASAGGVGWSIDSPDAGQMRLSAFEEGGQESIVIDHNQSVGWPIVRPGADSLWDWGSDSVRWRNGYSDTLTLTTTLSLGATPQLSVTGNFFRYDPGTTGGLTKVDSYLRAQGGTAVTGTTDGRPGGDLYIEAGVGSDGGATGPTDGGNGGTLYLRAGDGGASVGEAVTDGQGGDVIIDAGNGGGGDSTDGVVTVGATNAYSVAVGKSDGALGFFGATPVVRSAAYTPTNVTPDRSFNADTVAVAELADIVGTMIADLQNLGIFQ